MPNAMVGPRQEIEPSTLAEQCSICLQGSGQRRTQGLYSQSKDSGYELGRGLDLVGS